ncbi:MAG: hypothetical protein A2Z88_02750 [Omnitrophica WOR_2 bacterium GWA2_47_8]|nr:MAG: hypothetical protein A2Z88_02750 [Omnitrophica WOR_2 bacterium GWA2_47_8]
MGLKIFQKYRKERRQYPRYGAKDQIAFSLLFDVQTKIKYQILTGGGETILSKKYPGISKDISAEGMCFLSSNHLNNGDIIRVEVYKQESSRPIYMDGEVRWCKPVVVKSKDTDKFEIGIKIFNVNKKPVTTQQRGDVRVVWSEVLEAIIGDPQKVVTGKKP